MRLATVVPKRVRGSGELQPACVKTRSKELAVWGSAKHKHCVSQSTCKEVARATVANPHVAPQECFVSSLLWLFQLARHGQSVHGVLRDPTTTCFATLKDRGFNGLPTRRVRRRTNTTLKEVHTRRCCLSNNPPDVAWHTCPLEGERGGETHAGREEKLLLRSTNQTKLILLAADDEASACLLKDQWPHSHFQGGWPQSVHQIKR
jgi:hypothetical protein